MNDKQKDYIVRNFNKYGIEDIKTPAEMIELLNILEAHGETLDGLHDTSCGDMFCDIFFNYDGTDDNAVYHALLDHNIFYTSKADLCEGLRDSLDEHEEIKTMTDDELLQYVESECYDDMITKTTDGYVRTIYY